MKLSIEGYSCGSPTRIFFLLTMAARRDKRIRYIVARRKRRGQLKDNLSIDNLKAASRLSLSKSLFRHSLERARPTSFVCRWIVDSFVADHYDLVCLFSFSRSSKMKARAPLHSCSPHALADFKTLNYPQV